MKLFSRSEEEPQVAVALPPELAAEVAGLVAKDRLIDAIKLVRRRTGLGIVPAKRAIDKIAQP
jgi:ribosomal protein L7/L12